MRRHRLLLVCASLVVLLCCGLFSPVFSLPAQVQVTVEAPWRPTPLYAEVLEFLHTSISPKAHWQLVDRLIAGTPNDSEDGLVELSALKGTDIGLLRWALGTRHFAPKVEAQRATHRELRALSSSSSSGWEQEANSSLDIFVARSSNQRFFCRVRTASQLEDLLERGHCSEQTTAAPLLLFPGADERCWAVDDDEKSGQEHDIDDDQHLTAIVFYHFPSSSTLSPAANEEFQRAHKLLVASSEARRTRYCLRVADVAVDTEQLMYLRGYEVELALKNLEYKAVNEVSQGGLGASSDSNGDENDEESAAKHERTPDELISEFESLPEGSIDTLPEQSLAYIARAAEPWDALYNVAHNFPLVASTIANTSLSSFTSSHYWCFFRGHDALLVNGRQVKPNPFEFIGGLQSELELLAEINSLPLTKSSKAKIPYLAAGAAGAQIRFNVRSPSIYWLNDLQDNDGYDGWLEELDDLQPYPGQFQLIRKNLINTVLIVDVLDWQGMSMLLNLASSTLQGFPVRLGVILTAPPQDDDAERTVFAKDLGTAMHTIFGSEHQIGYKLRWLMNFMNSVGHWQPIEKRHVDELLSNLHYGFRTDNAAVGRLLRANTAATQLGFLGGSSLFLNGVWMRSSNPMQEMMDVAIRSEYPQIFRLVQSGVLTESKARTQTGLYEAILDSSGALQRRNPVLAAQPVRFVTLPLAELRSLGVVYLRSPEHDTTDDTQTLTYHIVGDFDAAHTARLAAQAMSNIAARPLAKEVRIGFIDTTNGRSHTWRVLTAALHSHSTSSAARRSAWEFVEQLLLATAASGVQSNVDGALLRWPDRFTQKLAQQTLLDELARTQSAWSSKQEGLPKLAVLVNGRIYDVPEELELDASDFAFIDGVEYGERVQKRLLGRYPDFLQTLEIDESVSIDDRTSDFHSDLVVVLVSLLSHELLSEHRSTVPSQCAGSAVFRSANTEDAPLEVTWIANPLGSQAPAVMALLQFMLDINAASSEPIFSVSIVLNMPQSIDDNKLPLKKFVRYTLAGEPVAFDRLPNNRLMTMQVLPPSSWLVGSTHASLDLDNIVLANAPELPLVARHKLEYLLFDGSCTGESGPPQGLQLTLSSTSGLTVSDTIVMQNMGYFQLKALPGLWQLTMAPGRASRLYRFENAVEVQTASIAGFNSQQQYRPLRVERRPGFENEQLLSTDDSVDIEVTSEFSVWNSLSSMWGEGSASAAKTASSSSSMTATETDKATIHVFSLASGHLYERFTKIMILSVLNHTEAPVKFWLLSNYLSPGFKEMIPHMAEHFGFQYELVTYQWPSWLRAQTEKQRIMWGYKILFLDVLFPLNLDRIIFVDADQIVRADLSELMELDLQGHVYGYTPFCSSRTEMDGFRFWKQGFWEQHLWGKPYHISALYVVDLKRFRRMGAGDILRSNYDGLAADPNSLANLDQDLPNYLQHYLPIYSLPQDWLWCETWCDDESKKTAKTIDLCNNPLTKTPKLENALRIVPEWTTYDERVKEFERSRI